MALETGTYISDLVATNPLDADQKAQGAGHLRLIKAATKATFPNVTGAVTPTHTELNYVDGVTSAIQTQLDAKAPNASPTFTGTAVLPSTTSIGNVSATELSYLDGVTSAIQTQFSTEIAARAAADALLAPLASPALTGTPTAPTATAGTSTTQVATTAFVGATAFSAALPSQTGNAGKFVTTDGSSASWASAAFTGGSLTSAINTARATVASAATTADIWAAAGNQIDWTGTTTCTGFPAAPQAGAERVLICAGAAPFTAGANMLIDGVSSGNTMTCAANDTVIVRAVTAAQFKLSRVKYDGTANVGAGDHCVTVHTGNGFGATYYQNRRFTTAMTNVGTGITYADSAANGASFTINEDGLYAFVYQDFGASAAWNTAVTLNYLAINSPASIPVANRLVTGYTPASTAGVTIGGVFRLTATDVIRCVQDQQTNSTDEVYFSIRKVGS